MQIQEHRMQCLRMAFELGGNPDTVLAAAERLLHFASGTQPATAAIADVSVDAPAVAAVGAAATLVDDQPTADEPVHADAPAAVVADPIAACGTAMLMTQSGDLADATPAPELAAVAEAPPVTEHAEAAAFETAAEQDPVAEAVAPEPVTVEVAASEPAAETLAVDAPLDAEEASAVEADGEHVAEEAATHEPETTIEAAPEKSPEAVISKEAELEEVEAAESAEPEVVLLPSNAHTEETAFPHAATN